MVVGVDELTLPQGFLGENAEYVTVSVGIERPYAKIPSVIFPSGTMLKYNS